MKELYEKLCELVVLYFEQTAKLNDSYDELSEEEKEALIAEYGEKDYKLRKAFTKEECAYLNELVYGEDESSSFDFEEFMETVLQNNDLSFVDVRNYDWLEEAFREAVQDLARA